MILHPWLIPVFVLVTAICLAVFDLIGPRAAILICLAFIAGASWAAWFLIHVNGR